MRVALRFARGMQAKKERGAVKQRTTGHEGEEGLPAKRPTKQAERGEQAMARKGMQQKSQWEKRHDDISDGKSAR